MRTRFAIARRQSPRHPCQDRAGRVGGTLIDGDGTALVTLAPTERARIERAGECFVEAHPERGVFYAVVDGVGGAPKAGETAQLLLDRLPLFFTDDSIPPTLPGLAALMDRINAESFAWGLIPGTERPLGAAAATVAWCARGRLRLVHVGDTCAYHLDVKTRQFRLLTVQHGEGNTMARYVGQGAGFQVDQFAVANFAAEDLVCLFTDGVAKGLRPQQAARSLLEHYSEHGWNLRAAAEQVCLDASKRGSTDDITVCLVENAEE